MGMKQLIVVLLLLQLPAPTFRLTVTGGTGSGRYVCGARVLVTAPLRWPTTAIVDGVSSASVLTVFDRWAINGYPDPVIDDTDPPLKAFADLFWPLARQAGLIVTMPCFDVRLVATYR
jgi:hypothetical protein